METNPTEDTAVDNNYSGDAFRAGSVGDPGEGADLSSNPMTDYRGVDEGLTSVGSTDQNADMSTADGLGVPGVRMGDSTPSVQTGAVTTADDGTRGVAEETIDTLTGDDRDDKTGGVILNDLTTQRHAP